MDKLPIYKETIDPVDPERWVGPGPICLTKELI